MQEYLQTFDFSAQPVRIVMRADAPWFVAADVCRILGISNPRDAVADLDEDEQSSVSRAEMTVATTDGQKNRGGAQFFNLISESGLYALVFKSRKEEAKAFRRWVTSEVLPALRRTGRYAVQAGAVQEERLSILEFVSDCCSGWSMERRAVMVGHTVEILSAYDGLQGCYARVQCGDTGDGLVLVALLGSWGERREICYATREVRHVAMDDAIAHDADEECRLIRRSVQLACPEDYMPYNQIVTAELAEAVKARLSRLRAQIRAIQRAKSTRPGNPFCTALVVGKGVGA